MSRILNLTPHEVTVYDEQDRVMMRFAPEPKAARCGTMTMRIGDVNGIPLTRTVMTKMYDLPEPEEDTYYIVSRIVAEHNRHRHDLLVPNEMVKDFHDGHKFNVGCRSLALMDC